jgi:hypothetical protein
MQNLQALVAEFHRKFRHPVFNDVNFETLCSKKVADLRLRLLIEEINEGEAAENILNGDEFDESEKQLALVEIFDALVDVAVITLGTACVYGLKLDSLKPTEETLMVLEDSGGIFNFLQVNFWNLTDNLENLCKYPNTKGYLVSAVLRNLQDLLDTCTGMAEVLGFPFEAGFVEVMASNISKLGEDGQPIYREDGKILKGPNYFKPNLEKILDAHFTQSA